VVQDLSTIDSKCDEKLKSLVPFILSEGHLANEGISPTSLFYYPKDLKLLKSIHQESGSRKVKQYEIFDFLEEISDKSVRGSRIHCPLNHVRYSKFDAVCVPKGNLGWIDCGGAHHESLFTKIGQSYIQPRKYGVDYRRCLYSPQTGTGRLTHGQALAQPESFPYQSETIEQENNEKLLSFIYETYWRIFRTTHSCPSASYE